MRYRIKQGLIQESKVYPTMPAGFKTFENESFEYYGLSSTLDIYYVFKDDTGTFHECKKAHSYEVRERNIPDHLIYNDESATFLICNLDHPYFKVKPKNITVEDLAKARSEFIAKYNVLILDIGDRLSEEFNGSESSSSVLVNELYQNRIVIERLKLKLFQ